MGRPWTRRCLLAGDAHNTAVMFRLCEMWFALGGEAPVAGQFATAAARVPSWKFLPLAYQLASRLARPGRHPDLDAAGFTARGSCPELGLPCMLCSGGARL